MKVLHIIAGAKEGGAESCAIDTIRALGNKGIKQTLICRPHPNFLKLTKDCELKSYTLRFSPLLKWLQEIRINLIIKEEKPDLIHCWMNRAASFTPKQANIPVLGWFGGYYDLKYYKNCDFFMGVSKDIVRHISEQIEAPERAFVGHVFGTLDKINEFRKSDFNIPESAKVVLLLSRMHWKKGIDLLIDAAQYIDDNVYFLLAGDGPDINRYKAQVKTLNLEERVIFLGWQSDRLGLLNIADVCVLPSRYEPFGIVITEAWFAGVPLVATKAAGAKNYVRDLHDGLLVEIDDLWGLVDAITTALENQELRTKLIINGKKSYEKNFSRDAVISTLLESYKKMIVDFKNL